MSSRLPEGAGAQDLRAQNVYSCRATDLATALSCEGTACEAMSHSLLQRCHRPLPSARGHRGRVL